MANSESSGSPAPGRGGVPARPGGDRIFKTRQGKCFAPTPSCSFLRVSSLPNDARQSAFHGRESLMDSGWRHRLGVNRKSGDDTSGYFNERLQAAANPRSGDSGPASSQRQQGFSELHFPRAWPWMEPRWAAAARNAALFAVLSATPPNRLSAIVITW
jgi:hypothetical protein